MRLLIYIDYDYFCFRIAETSWWFNTHDGARWAQDVVYSRKRLLIYHKWRDSCLLEAVLMTGEEWPK